MVCNGILCHWYRFATLFIRTRYFWLSLSVLIVFPNISHICCYFIFYNYTFWPCITHMYITHMFWLVSRKYFVLKYSNSCISPFVYWRNHRLCCSWRFWWHRPYFVKFLLNLCILVIHYSFVCQVSIDLSYFSPFKIFWVLASSLVIVFKLFLIFG